MIIVEQVQRIDRRVGNDSQELQVRTGRSLVS